jgi:nucleoside 2-deoxyribosyltransferase
MRKVYLAGPINGCTDDECKGWRSVAKALLSATDTCLDPMDRDYRGIEQGNYVEIVRSDLADIQEADWVLVNASRPSWGTAMEIAIASRSGKPVVAFSDAESVSPWIWYFCVSVFRTVEDACKSHSPSSFVEAAR